MAERHPCGQNAPFSLHQGDGQCLLASGGEKQCQNEQEQRTNRPSSTPHVGREVPKLFWYQEHSSG